MKYFNKNKIDCKKWQDNYNITTKTNTSKMLRIWVSTRRSSRVHVMRPVWTAAGAARAGPVVTPDVRGNDAINARKTNSGAALVNKRVEVWGKGKGTVIDIKKSLGKATKHVILFDNGARETIQLSKYLDYAAGEGIKFYLI